MVQHPNFSSWWGRHSVEAGRLDFWQIGPLHLWIQHLPHQWRLNWKHGSDWLEPRIRAVPGSHGEAPPADAQQTSCMYGESRDELIFAPALADRPVVTRLTHPVQILPGEQVTLYIVSPLWLRMEMAQPSKVMHELPIFRMSDTWFGPMSTTGELCYASRGAAFLQLRDVPLRLHCVITAVTIRNSGNKPLPVLRIKLPLPRLSLFYSPRTGFWTDTVTLESRGDAEMASLKLERQPPPDASPTQFVAGPRMGASEPNSVIRAFSALFRERSST